MNLLYLWTYLFVEKFLSEIIIIKWKRLINFFNDGKLKKLIKKMKLYRFDLDIGRWNYKMKIIGDYISE
jgi:hypothetical protein